MLIGARKVAVINWFICKGNRLVQWAMRVFGLLSSKRVEGASKNVYLCVYTYVYVLWH